MAAETARAAYRECLEILASLARGAGLVGDVSAHTAFTQAHGEIRRAMNRAAGTDSAVAEGRNAIADAQAGGA